jgi:hypothetical protein
VWPRSMKNLVKELRSWLASIAEPEVTT